MAIHDERTFERTQELIAKVAHLVGGYRRRLEEGGMPPAEAYELAQRLESRLLDPIFDAAEAGALEAYDVEEAFNSYVRGN